jgi:uncharacterized protein involved in outer membrane biogenesis
MMGTSLLGIVGAVIATLLGLVVLAAVAGVALLTSGALNGVIEEAIAAQIGRPARLEQAPSLGYQDGAVTLRFGPLSVANALWAADRHPEFATIQQIDVTMRLRQLLDGEVELPRVVIEGPQVHFARNEDGEVNWLGPKAEEGPVWVPKIENIVIREALVTYADAVAAIDAEVALDEATGRLGGDQNLELQASGRLQDAPLQVRVSGGSVNELLNQAAMSEPAAIEARIGGSRIRAEATSFADLESLDAKLEIDAEPTLTAILARIGIAEADLPPFQATATVEPGDTGSLIKGARARIAGQIADLAEPERGFSAELAVDAPELGAILADFDVRYADRVPGAEIDGEVAHDGDGTTFALQGSVGGDAIELHGGYDGGLMAVSNPRVDLQLEGSALGVLPEQLGFATRAIESYRIAAKVEERSDGPSPVNLDVMIENTRVRFEGNVDELRALKGIEGRVRAQGPDPAAVLDLFKLPSISLPPYDVGGEVTWRDDQAKVAGMDGKLGDSDISGDAGIDLRPEPPAVTAKLHSDLLDLDDLAGLVGAPPAAPPGETASPAQEQRAEQAEQDDRLLPTKEIDPDLWQGVDLNIEFDADRFESIYLPVDRIRVHVVSDDGWLTVDPLVTGLADGTVVGFASMDATQDPLASEFDIRIEALQLQDLLAKLGIEGEGFGGIDGRIRLRGRGTSVDKLVGSADGQAALTMDGGAIDALIVEAIGIDIAESILVLLDSIGQTEEDKTPIRCAIVNLEFEDGIATTRPVLIDTVDSKITIDGQVNLRDETLDIFIESRPKDPSPFSANQPIQVDGPLLSPSVNPAPGRTENEALGWLLALAGALPFLDIGGEEDSPCGRLITEAKEAAAARPQ